MPDRDTLILTKINTEYPTYAKISELGEVLSQQGNYVCVKESIPQYIETTDLDLDNGLVLLKEESANFVKVSTIKDLLVVQTPVITDDGNGNVTITCATSGATIRYTIDGTNPAESSTAYSVPFEVSESCTIKARAYKSGFNPSNITSLDVEVETFDPNDIVITASVADIWLFKQVTSYALNSSNETADISRDTGISGIIWRVEPNEDRQRLSIFNTNGAVAYFNVYTLNPTKTKRLKAYSYLLDISSAGNKTSSYEGETIIRLVAPVINEIDGLVTITPNDRYADETPDKILYRIDDGDYIEYTAPFTVEESCTVYAYAQKEGYEDGFVSNKQIEIIVEPTEWVAIEDMKLGTEDIRSISYGNGKFVAVAGHVGSSGQASYSTDGINWIAISDLKLDTYSPSTICYGDGKFVVCATTNKGAYSTDGITWTKISDLGFGAYGSASGICYGNGKFVAASSFIISYSTDGITWTSVDFKPLNGIMDICYGNGKFVAVTGGMEDEEIIYSTDGINWNSVADAGFGTDDLLSVCYGNGKFITIGEYDKKAAYSTDGITWTQISDVKVDHPEVVSYGNGKFIIGGSKGQASYSTDGITWSAISDMKVGTETLESYIEAICYGNDKFVVGTYKGLGSYCIC